MPRRAPPKVPSDEAFAAVLESAAKLQRLVPDAVLVGGSAAVLHAHHRISLDHDHVVADLRDRFDAVLDALETDEGWALNRLTPGKIVLGELDGIETGIRQMIRSTPLEVERAELPSGATLTVPTIEEALRIKAFLTVRRNQVRDYLDVAALADRMGTAHAARVLLGIDDYYADRRSGDEAVSSQVARQLADPRPKDVTTIEQLARYKCVSSRWATWKTVREVLADVVEHMVEPRQ